MRFPALLRFRIALWRNWSERESPDEVIKLQVNFFQRGSTCSQGNCERCNVARSYLAPSIRVGAPDLAASDNHTDADVKALLRP